MFRARNRRRLWAKRLDRDDVLILDTETTGLGSRAEIVEIGILDTTGRVVYDALVMPEGRIPREASDVHGITRQTLREAGAKPWPEHHRAVMNLLQDARLIVVYNVEYDARLIAQTVERHDLAVPRRLPEWACAMLAYAEHRGVRGRRGDYRWHKLQDTMRHEGIKVPGKTHGQRPIVSPRWKSCASWPASGDRRRAPYSAKEKTVIDISGSRPVPDDAAVSCC